jgi:multiple sugar transport system substrate-binding protein
MFKNNKLASALLSIIFVLSLVLSGCSSKSDNSTTAQPATADSKATGEPVATAAPAEKVKLEFWVQKFEDYNANWYKKWTAEFNKTHPNTQINLTIVPGDVWDQKMKAAQAAGNQPEIVSRSYNQIAPAAQLGQILALDSYMDPKVWTDLYENVEKFVNVKGSHYAFPMLVEPSAVLFYRKDFFKEAGLDPEKPPVTWDELIDYGKKLTKDGRFGLKIAGNAGDYSWSSWGAQMQFGHRPISDDWSKATVMDDGYKALVGFYKSLYDQKIVPKEPLKGYADGADFGEGKEAMAITGSWVMGQLRADYKGILDNVGVAPVPTKDGDATKPTASLGGWTLTIDAKSKHPQQAADFITWLYAGDTKIMEDFFKISGYSKFSPRKTVDAAINNDPVAQKDLWRKTVAEKIVPFSVSEPTYPWEISLAFGTAIESATKGKDVDTVLKTAEKDINDFIANKKLAGTNPQQ